MKKSGLWLLVFFLGICPLSLFPGTAIQNESGFIKIEPVDFLFHYNSYSSRLELRSSEANIWYTFLAADHEGDRTPIFLFFNGGPGSATSCGLLSMNTSHYTLDNTIDSGGGDRFIANPVPWTQMGHLLYIDARETGFSYNFMSNTSDYMSRWREFNAQNFNPFFDAADFIRVLLRFLAAHPSLQDHPVIIVGESYGGIRATSMLYLLLNYTDLANEREMYQDPALSREIQNHLDKVFPDYAGRQVPPEVIARQFGHQVLIQACISYGYQTKVQDQMLRQSGSVVYKLAEEIGIPYNPNTSPSYYVTSIAKRDIYNYTKPDGWLDNFFVNAANMLRFTQNLSLVTGMDVKSISGLYARNRANAYRLLSLETPAALPPAKASSLSDSFLTQTLFMSPRLMQADMVPVEPGDMSAVFGTLQPWDRYFLSTNGMANGAFHFYNIALLRGYEVYYLDSRFGRMFLKNLLFVNTFITNAAYDLIVYSPAIPYALLNHTDIVGAIGHMQGSPEWNVSYKPNAFPDVADPGRRQFYFPTYTRSCHAVSLTQPQELFADVSTWLVKKGVVLNNGGQQ